MKFHSSLRKVADLRHAGARLSRLTDIRGIFREEKHETARLEEEREGQDSWGELYLEGSEEGFNRIHERFRKPVLRYVLSRLNDSEIAEEIAQEVFIKLHRFRESYQRGRSFESWFWTVVRNTTHDWLRKGMNSPIVENESCSTDDGAPSFLDTLACSRLNAEGQLLRKSIQRMLFRRMRSLTKLQRKVIWLRFVHDLPLQEIAERLGLSLASVKCLMYRARACLQVDGTGDFVPA